MPLGESVTMALELVGLFSVAACCILGARYARIVSVSVGRARAAAKRRRVEEFGAMGMELVVLDKAAVFALDDDRARLIARSERLAGLLEGRGAINALTTIGWVRLSLPDKDDKLGGDFFYMRECGSADKPAEISKLFGHGHATLAEVSEEIKNNARGSTVLLVVVPPEGGA